MTVKRSWWILFLITLCAGLCAAIFLLVANDVLSVTDEAVVKTVTLTEEDPAAAAKALKAAGVIRYPVLFSVYCRLTRDEGNLKTGNYTLSCADSYAALATTLRGNAPVRNVDVKITFPEGSTVAQMIDRLTAAGIGSAERYTEVINTADFPYDYLPPKETERVYRLEGYLYPDTYWFSTRETEEAVIDKMLANFDAKFTQKYRDRCEKLGKTPDEIVTLASMISAEARYAEEYTKVSAVFWNRLRSPRFSFLESDATVRYALYCKEGILRPVTADDLALQSPYNTYHHAGLPPGAIANPGLCAINAALFPAKTKDYYFVAAADGHTRFARTYAEHCKNIAENQKKKGN